MLSEQEMTLVCSYSRNLAERLDFPLPITESLTGDRACFRAFNRRSMFARLRNTLFHVVIVDQLFTLRGL
jgi:hypothetical protein